MNTLTYNIQHRNFFCPATGQKILSEEFVKPSPATLFIFFHGAGMEFAVPEIMVLYKEAQRELERGRWDDYIFNFDTPDMEYRAYEILVREKLTPQPHVVLFEMTQSGPAIGPFPQTVYVGVDVDGGGEMNR